MGKQFRWDTDADFAAAERPLPIPQKRPFPLITRWLVGTAVSLFFLLAGWLLLHSRATQTEARLQASVQDILDLEYEAFRRGDGDLFFVAMSDDPAWQAAHLLPLNQAVIRAQPVVTAVRLQGEELWATVAWEEGAQTWQRAAFFRWQAGHLRHVPTSGRFWGARQQRDEAWGTLVYHAADASLAAAIAGFVADHVAVTCATGCPGRLPFTLELRPDYAETAVPHILQLPSPRLVALDENDQPAPLFWALLRRRLDSHLQPVYLRFALPPLLPVGIHLVDYEQAAADFMVTNPRVTIELVTLAEIPQDPGLLHDFDGAAFVPLLPWVAAGAVLDLTALAATDPTFAPEEFYRQMWQGAQWRDRLWFVPQAGEMQVIFYDRHAYEAAGLAEPSLRWTWAEMEADLQALDAALPFAVRPYPTYRFLDVTPDLLFAYAYGQNSAGLTPESAAAALAWYQQLADQPRLMPDVTALTPEERRQARFRWQASLWVDQLVYYEHGLQMVDSMGVVPFPGAEQFEGATPLHLSGAFITSHSQHPQAAWEWLAFLSRQPTAPRYRLIPARASVAARTAYWSTLPRPLNEALRAAFPFARPVTLADQLYFSWEQITAVTTHQLTPQQAAQEIPALIWFTAP